MRYATLNKREKPNFCLESLLVERFPETPLDFALFIGFSIGIGYSLPVTIMDMATREIERNGRRNKNRDQERENQLDR